MKFIDGVYRGTAIDYSANGCTVTLSKGRYTEKATKSRHGGTRCNNLTLSIMLATPNISFMAPPTTTNMSSTVPVSASTSGSRSRPQARRKPNDDAAYLGPSIAGGSAVVLSGTKRHAGERIEGEPRVKRKRVETSNNNVVARRTGADGTMDLKGSLVKISLSLSNFIFSLSFTTQVKFTSMPIAVLYRYLSHYDLVPTVYPSPLTADDPPAPSSLENDTRQQRSPTPTVQAATPANRPRRESKEQNRRRSSRLAEDDTRGRMPVLADIDEFHRVLAGIAERHFKEEPRRDEVDVLASFMCKVKGGL
jgi:hypothetical protein